MHLEQYIKYKDPYKFPFDQNPVSSDYLLTLVNEIGDKKPPTTIKEIVSLFPKREPKYQLTVLPFFVFCTNRTIYSALKDVEEVFTEFYLRTGVLPNIRPLASFYLRHPKDLPLGLLADFNRRGGVVYGT